MGSGPEPGWTGWCREAPYHPDMPHGDGSGPADPKEVVLALAQAIRDDDRKLDRFTGPGFEVRASVVTPGRRFESLDARFSDLRARYEIVQVLPELESVRELEDGRFVVAGEAHLTRADGGGVSTAIHWIVTVADGSVVLIEGELGADGAGPRA